VLEPAPPAWPDEGLQASQPNRVAGELPAAPAAGRLADAGQEQGRPNEPIRLMPVGLAQPAAPAAVSLLVFDPLPRASQRPPRWDCRVAAVVVPIESGLGAAEMAEP
jgi:hypothetical protein